MFIYAESINSIYYNVVLETDAKSNLDCKVRQCIDPEPGQNKTSFFHHMPTTASIFRPHNAQRRRTFGEIDCDYLIGKTAEKRSRGRSPTRWTDQVKISSFSKLYTVVRDAQDRNWWRQIIRSSGWYTTCPRSLQCVFASHI
jgi:IS30 family transposase